MFFAENVFEQIGDFKSFFKRNFIFNYISFFLTNPFDHANSPNVAHTAVPGLVARQGKRGSQTYPAAPPVRFSNHTRRFGCEGVGAGVFGSRPVMMSGRFQMSYFTRG